MKTLLILLDGMRPDAIADIPQVKELMGKSYYTMKATTVMPSVTLPCHMSLFLSVPPTRHGTTTNTYAPQVRPVKGLCEVLCENGKKCAIYYDWEELRDLTRPGSLVESYYCNGHKFEQEKTAKKVTDAAIERICADDTDFIFLYMGYPDGAGHGHGWMSEEYMRSLETCFKNIERTMASLSDEWAVIITADHGGHDRSHGTEMPEDMLIPIFITGNGIEGTGELCDCNIMDIAPTITKLFGIKPDSDWEGKSII